MGKQASMDGLLVAATARREIQPEEKSGPGGRKVAWKELHLCQASAFTFRRAPAFCFNAPLKHREVQRSQCMAQ